MVYMIVCHGLPVSPEYYFTLVTMAAAMNNHVRHGFPRL